MSEKVDRASFASGKNVQEMMKAMEMLYATRFMALPLSDINGNVYECSDQLEYDQWETLGNTGWNFNSLFNVSKGLNEAFPPPMSSENIEYVVGDHGLSGLLPTSFSSSAPDFHKTIMQAVVNAGGYLSLDQAGGNVTGIAHVTNAHLASNNTRATSTDFPYSYRSNLQVTLNATITKINWASVGRLTGRNAIASGVEYVDGNGDTQTAVSPTALSWIEVVLIDCIQQNATTVILSGGPWVSPPILEHSGIGNLGIDSIVDLVHYPLSRGRQLLTRSQEQMDSISEGLQGNWNNLGPVAPELPDTISPFIAGFKLQAHFKFGNDVYAMDLLCRMWGYMLYTPLSVQSTLLEGFTANGSISYRSYHGYSYNPAYTSHAHGWSTGPTSTLTYYVLGLTVTSPQGADWSLAPHVVDMGLSDVQGGFETFTWFGAHWVWSEFSGFQVQVNAAKGILAAAHLSWAARTRRR
ncbi:hypothetical protein H0H92_015283 [Tricholoma furcatifolium]|nr:hypothetical protein H0H92_015283 [Tricholoma furcatifolium]